MTLQDVIKRGLELGLEAVEVYACNSESNTLKLDEGKHAYEIFDKKLEDCIKVVLKP